MKSINNDLNEAHKHSAHHREEILAGEKSGCFYCMETFTAKDIKEWIDGDQTGIGQTALCPRCGVDSILGERSGFPITKEFLSEMRKFWFDDTGPSELAEKV